MMPAGGTRADGAATFADLEYQGKKRRTRREIFLERMDGLIPWQRLEDRIRPFYPKAGKSRRRPAPILDRPQIWGTLSQRYAAMLLSRKRIPSVELAGLTRNFMGPAPALDNQMREWQRQQQYWRSFGW